MGTPSRMPTPCTERLDKVRQRQIDEIVGKINEDTCRVVENGTPYVTEVALNFDFLPAGVNFSDLFPLGNNPTRKEMAGLCSLDQRTLEQDARLDELDFLEQLASAVVTKIQVVLGRRPGGRPLRSNSFTIVPDAGPAVTDALPDSMTVTC